MVGTIISHQVEHREGGTENREVCTVETKANNVIIHEVANETNRSTT